MAHGTLLSANTFEYIHSSSVNNKFVIGGGTEYANLKLLIIGDEADDELLLRLWGGSLITCGSIIKHEDIL